MLALASAQSSSLHICTKVHAHNPLHAMAAQPLWMCDRWCMPAHQVVEDLRCGPSSVAAGYELLQDTLDALDIPLDVLL